MIEVYKFLISKRYPTEMVNIPIYLPFHIFSACYKQVGVFKKKYRMYQLTHFEENGKKIKNPQDIKILD